MRLLLNAEVLTDAVGATSLRQPQPRVQNTPNASWVRQRVVMRWHG
eukprot:SAG31_NODE_763_length_12265_cov_3.024984_5_plen_46_part_00